MTWYNNPIDRYWTVTDTDPSTHVFQGTSGTYVVLANADYVQYVADGGTTTTIATDDAVKQERARIISNLGDKPAKQACRVATTGNITLSGEQTIDGVAVEAGNRVLVRAQTDPLEDQIYVCQAGAWEYATDVDTSQKLIGATVIVIEGTNNAKSLWMTDWATDHELGTDQVAWYPIGGIRSAALPENSANSGSDTFPFWNNGVLPSRVAFTDLANAIAGQYVYGEYTAHAALSTIIPADNTIPQNDEGTQIISLSLPALTVSTNKWLVIATFSGTSDTGTNSILGAIFADSDADAVAASMASFETANYLRTVTIEYEYEPGDTDAHTLALRVGAASGDLYLNGNSAGRLLGGVMLAAMSAREIRA